jgi:hypothetical protein
MPDLLVVNVPVSTVWTEPSAPRALDEPAVLDAPDLAAWTAAMPDESSRADLNGRTLTQLLLGDPVQVLEEAGDWVRVTAPGQPSSAHPVGYPGWMRRAHLAAVADPTPLGVAWTVVRSLTAPCRLPDGEQLTLSFGTLLVLEAAAASEVVVRLPDGRQGTLARSDVLQGGDRQTASGPAPLSAAREFVGLRYLWGGTSGWGTDCSGLVHLAFRLCGVVVPRDAKDQAVAPSLRLVPLDEVRAGDLYFFAEPGKSIHHVGFASRPVGPDADRWMLHAPGPAGLVEDAPMDQDRLRTLVSAGRFEVPGEG